MARRSCSRSRLAAAALLPLLLGLAREPAPFDIPAARPPRVVSADFFGTHFHRLGHAQGDFPATSWPGAAIGSLRLWDCDTRWADIEPQPGRFEFARLDDAVAQAQAHGANVLLVLGSPPRWAAARPDEYGPYGPGSASEPRELALWDRYVRAVVHRYRGRIAQYELWNEPYFSDLPEDRGQASAFYTGSVSSLVELGRHARAAIRAEDPGAQLLTPGFVGSARRLDLFLKAGGADVVDAVAYHLYADDDAGLVRLQREVRAVMARDGLGAMPLYDTESGFAIPAADSRATTGAQVLAERRRAAALLARSMILAASLGVERFYQYAWDDGRMGMLLDDGRTTTDSLPAHAAVRRWLLGTTLLGCRGVDDRAVRCDGTRAGEHLSIFWLADGRQGRAAALSGIAGPARIDGVGPAIAPAGRVALPADGMPVAIWTSGSAQASHVHVIDAD